VPNLEPQFAKGEEKRSEEKEATTTSRSKSPKGRRVDEGGEMDVIRGQWLGKLPCSSCCGLAHLSHTMSVGVLDRQPPEVDECGLAEIGSSKEETRGT
jgi:hypothetical protein